MSYTKEERNEDMEQERIEDIREKANEFDEGDFDYWVGLNKNELVANFIDEYNEDWIDYCKSCWKEHNEELI